MENSPTRNNISVTVIKNPSVHSAASNSAEIIESEINRVRTVPTTEFFPQVTENSSFPAPMTHNSLSEPRIAGENDAHLLEGDSIGIVDATIASRKVRRLTSSSRVVAHVPCAAIPPSDPVGVLGLTHCAALAGGPKNPRKLVSNRFPARNWFRTRRGLASACADEWRRGATSSRSRDSIDLYEFGTYFRPESDCDMYPDF